MTVFPLLLKFKLTRKNVHVGDKCFVECFLGLLFLIALDYFANCLSYGHRSVITAWKHQGVKKVFKWKVIADLQVCRGSVHLWCLKGDSHLVLFDVNSIFFAGQQTQITCHYFGNWRYLYYFGKVLCGYWSHSLHINDSITWCCYSRDQKLLDLSWLVNI